MKRYALIFLLFLMTALQGYSQIVFPRSLTDSTWEVTSAQLRNAILTGDSLDEMREICDSMTVQVNSALQVIQRDDTLIKSLLLLSGNQKEIISGKDILLRDEKKISSHYRNKYRLWMVLAILSGCLNVYQAVK